VGAEPYCYFAAYQGDVNTTLQTLRQQEFAAGRYNPVLVLPRFYGFPMTESSVAPGAQHSSIEEAMIAADADGTRSILDIFEVSNFPYERAYEDPAINSGIDVCFRTYPFSRKDLEQMFGTLEPSHQQVESVCLESDSCETIWAGIDRGTCRHIIVFDQGKPSEIFFAGYSFD